MKSLYLIVVVALWMNGAQAQYFLRQEIRMKHSLVFSPASRKLVDSVTFVGRDQIQAEAKLSASVDGQTVAAVKPVVENLDVGITIGRVVIVGDIAPGDGPSFSFIALDPRFSQGVLLTSFVNPQGPFEVLDQALNQTVIVPAARSEAYLGQFQDQVGAQFPQQVDKYQWNLEIAHKPLGAMVCVWKDEATRIECEANTVLTFEARSEEQEPSPVTLPPQE